MTPESVVYSYGTLLLDLLSGKHIPPSHVCIVFYRLTTMMENLCKLLCQFCNACSKLFCTYSRIQKIIQLHVATYIYIYTSICFGLYVILTFLEQDPKKMRKGEVKSVGRLWVLF